MRLVVLLWALWAAACAFAGPEESAVQVKHYSPGGAVECGSGTVVRSAKGKGSDVLTNWHVAPDAGRGVEVWVGTTTHPATWVRADSGLDLCLLHIVAELPVAQLADQPPPPGVALEQWGCSRGGPRKHKVGTSGRVDGRRAVTGGGAVLTNGLGAEPGDSGCGVFCGGKLVAVCWGTGGPGSESCVTLADVKKFLGRK